MTVYYKAVRPDGTDFRTGTIRYDVGATVTHPNPHRRDASGYLSVATVPTDCTGMSWPCRLLEVEAEVAWTVPTLPNKRATHSLTVVREVDAHVAFGPQGREVAALIERAGRLTDDEARRLAAAWDAAWDAARAAAWDAAWDAARAAARDAARAAARDAAWGLVVRDLIGTHGFTQEHYDTLTRPWREIVGPLHPDDADLRTEVAR